jgi:F0F1-type ATP synthase assembly protein I
MPDPLPPAPERSRLWRHAFAGTSFAITILVCLYIGVEIDRHFLTDPWGVVLGATAGFFVAFLNLKREFSNEKK